MRTIVGIDYSMRCPAVTVHIGDTWDIKNCKFFFLTDKKKFIAIKDPFYSLPIGEWSCNEERFYALALKTSEWFINTPPDKIFLEGYAFGAHGTVFEIGECTHALKQMLWERGYKVESVPPTRIKKFATGKGNSRKEQMYEAFTKETGWELNKMLNCSIGTSPSSDIIDSYYIAKYGFINT
jgi:Holliday junction resolvasome RuvABC endonuclease subunit